MKIALNIILVSSLVALPVYAHLQAGSLKPAGTETYAVGENISIEWVATQAHDGRYDIYYSKDGGKTYPVELAGPWQGSKTDGAKNVYLWKAPAAAASSQVRIRICQLYGGHCVEPGTYMMDSPANFTISATTGIESGNQTGAVFQDRSEVKGPLMFTMTIDGRTGMTQTWKGQ
jgi:hypothetical protein